MLRAAPNAVDNATTAAAATTRGCRHAGEKVLWYISDNPSHTLPPITHTHTKNPAACVLARTWKSTRMHVLRVIYNIELCAAAHRHIFIRDRPASPAFVSIVVPRRVVGGRNCHKPSVCEHTIAQKIELFQIPFIPRFRAHKMAKHMVRRGFIGNISVAFVCAIIVWLSGDYGHKVQWHCVYRNANPPSRTSHTVPAVKWICMGKICMRIVLRSSTDFAPAVGH